MINAFVKKTVFLLGGRFFVVLSSIIHIFAIHLKFSKDER